MPRRAVAALGLLVTVLLLLGLAPVASAHDYLVSSTPEQGEQVDVGPSEVTLSFNTSVGEQFAQVAVVDAAGATYQVGGPVVDGPTVTQQVAALAPGQDYTISYRVVSSDGHPIGGTVAFAVAGTPASDDAAATPPSGETDGSGDGSAEAQQDAGQTDEATADTTATTAAAGGGTSPLLWVAGALVLALLGAVGVGLARRRSATGS